MIARTLKHFAMRISEARAFGPIVRKLEKCSRNHARLRVLAYHRIDDLRADSPYHPGLISASPEQFVTQMVFLANHYHVCSMADTIVASRSEAVLPTDSVLLTFDDATKDFAHHAWPVLRSLGLPAALFVPTIFPDNTAVGFWWDQLYRAIMKSPGGTSIPAVAGSVTLSSDKQRQQLFRSLKEYLKTIPHSEFRQRLNDIVTAGGVPEPSDNNVLSWDALRQLDREGVTLAPHSHTHPMLNRMTPAEIRFELKTSVEVLESQIGHRVLRTLAYPAGGVNDTVVEAMQAGGFDTAFTTQRGVNDQTFEDPFRLRRINVGARTTLGLLRLQLANWGN